MQQLKTEGDDENLKSAEIKNRFESSLEGEKVKKC